MHRDDHIVELSENIVGEIERPVPSDVTLGAGKETEAMTAFVESPDVLDLGGEALFVQAVGLEGTLAVISDAEVLQAKFLSGCGHLFELTPARHFR